MPENTHINTNYKPIDNTDFAGKTAFITGAGSGIGLELARSLIAIGAKVIATDINMDSLNLVADELGSNCTVHQLDVSDEKAFNALARKLDTDDSLPDVVINNAGIAYLTSFTDTSSEYWQNTLNINVLGVVYGCRAFIPLWKKSGTAGHLVNISSVVSMAPMPLMSAYVASKYAVEGLSDVLAMELAGSNIKVCCVHPGVINTPIVKQEDKTNLPADKTELLQRYYEEKGATPTEVAVAVINGIRKNRHSVFVGPGSTAAPILKRILPRRWYRSLLVGQAKKAGYM